jgi:putative transposase
MGRISRKKLLYDGCFAHVFTRSIEKKYIFESEEDFFKIKTLLLKSKKAYPYKIHHYCIMNTHIHLAVSLSKADQFSE